MLNHVKKQTMTFTLTSVAAIFSLVLISGCGKTQSTESLLTEAKQYQQKGDHKAAIIQLKNVLQKNPDNIETRYLLGTIYNEVGESQSAEKELRKAVSLGMEPAKVTPELAKSLYLQNQFPKVLEELKTIPGNQFDVTIALLRGNTYLRLGKNQEAKVTFEQVLKEQKDNPEALLGLAKHALNEKDEKLASRLVDQATDKNPASIVAWLFKGDLLRAQSKFEPAHAAYDQVIKIKPDNQTANIAKAYLYITEKKFDAAKANIEAARKSDPSHIIIYYAQALLDYKQEKYAATWDALQQVLRVAPEHMPSVLLAGATHFSLGSLPQAEQHLKKYLEQYPDDTYARRLMVATLLKSGQTTRALSTLAPALKTNETDAQLLALAGEVHMQTKEYAKATEYFEKASAIAPDVAAIRTSLGMSRIGQGDTVRAIGELEKAINLDANSTQAGLFLVMSQIRLQEYDKALAAAQSLEKIQPDNPLVQNLKGGIYLGKNDVESARTSFLKALALQPTFYPAAENLSKIDLQEKKPEVAKKRFTSILDNDKKNIQAMTALARLAQSQANANEATSWLEKAHKENPDSLEPALNLAGHYLRSGEKAKALTLTQNMLVTNANSPALLDLLAVALMANNQQTAALDVLHKLTVLLPSSAQVQLHVANAHMSMQNLPAATVAVKKSLSLQPDFLEAQLAMASLEMRQHNFNGALAIAKKIQQKNSKSPVGFAMEGDIRMDQKNAALAIPAYERAYSINKNSTLLVKLHTALKKAGKVSEADARMGQWLKDNPDDYTSRMYFAGSHITDNRNKEAISQFQFILKKNPNNATVLNNMAWAYYKDKDFKAALENAEKAYQITGEEPAVLDTLGWILIEQGNNTRGLPLLQKAVSLAPNVAEIRFHFAQGLVKSGDKSGARKELEKLISNNAGFNELDAAKALLKQL